MAQDLNKQQLEILANSTHMTKEEIVANYLEFKKLINKDGLISLKSFTEFYCKLLPKMGEAEKFCKFIFNGKKNKLNNCPTLFLDHRSASPELLMKLRLYLLFNYFISILNFSHR